MDKAKSVIERLKNKSKRTGKSVQLYLQLLCQEEFLRKVSQSEFKNQLVLKGGLFIYTLTNFEGSIMFTNSWTQNPENKINYTHE